MKYSPSNVESDPMSLSSSSVIQDLPWEHSYSSTVWHDSARRVVCLITSRRSGLENIKGCVLSPLHFCTVPDHQLQRLIRLAMPQIASSLLRLFMSVARFLHFTPPSSSVFKRSFSGLLLIKLSCTSRDLDLYEHLDHSSSLIELFSRPLSLLSSLLRVFDKQLREVVDLGLTAA